MAQRRILYLKHILSRNENELIKKVYLAQKSSSSKGDFAKLLDKDLELFGLTHDEIASEEMTKHALKKELHKSAKSLAFAELFGNLQTKTKGKDLKYNKLGIQEYLTSAIFKKAEKEMLTSIRTQCVKSIKGNFPNLYNVCQHCPLECQTQDPQRDTQEYVFMCEKLGGVSTVDYEFIHGGVVDQHLVASEFSRRMTTRNQLLEGQEVSRCCHLPGGIPDQSTRQGAEAVHPV